MIIKTVRPVNTILIPEIWQRCFIFPANPLSKGDREKLQARVHAGKQTRVTGLRGLRGLRVPSTPCLSTIRASV